jgi:HSP20 family protein
MFGVIRKPRDPMLELLYNLERRMGRAFNEPFSAFDWTLPTEMAATAWTPAVDIFEEADVLRFVAELPGVKPENVKLTVEGNTLTIAGTKEQVAEEQAEKVHRYERVYGAFERTFTLPATVDAAKVKAQFENGVLNVVVPKLEKAKAQQIKVEIGKPEKALKG